MAPFRMFLEFLAELFWRRHLITELTRRDFKSGYLGSYLGVLWAFLLPIILTVVFWFVFQVGYGTPPVNGYPFVLWFVCGMFAFNFLQECISNGTDAILQNVFIVKKVTFSVGILPIIKILSALIIHLFFIALICFMLLASGHGFGLHVLQVAYYLGAAIVFVTGVTFLTSAVVVFFRDLKQLVGIIMQISFFMTPIFWSPQIIPERYRLLINFNPFYYIVQGYRDSFMNGAWFWEHPFMTLYFWTLTTFVFVSGAVVFRRLRPHFADVL